MTQNKAQFDKKLQFFGLDEADYRQFPKIAGWLRRLAPAALDRFYAKIRRTPQAARFFKSEQMISHARGKQLDHWLDLFDGRVDDAYRVRAENIGTVHARIGLEPGWYIGGYASMLAEIIPQMTHGQLARTLGLGKSGTQVATLVRTALLDMDIALSTYFAVEEQKRQAVIDQLGACLAALAKGDFSSKLTDLPPGYGRIEQDYESMRVSMESTLRTVADGALSISTGAAEIRQASDDLASRTERQAASLEETAAATDHLTDGVKRAADGAMEMSQIINQAEHEAQDGGKVVAEAVTAMSVIQKSATEIGSIVDLIDGIAFQTNLLALNAGVEAARAGDAGKGFAVVANEVRALAQRAADAAKGIKTLISTSIDQIERGGSLVAQSGEAFTSIVGRVSSISSKAREIADLAQEQSVSLQQVNSAIREMDQMTQSNAAMVEEANAAARSQADEASQLETLIAQFNLSKSTVTRLVQPRAQHHVATTAPAAPARPRQSASVVAHAVKPDNEDWSDF